MLNLRKPTGRSGLLLTRLRPIAHSYENMDGPGVLQQLELNFLALPRTCLRLPLGLLL